MTSPNNPRQEAEQWVARLMAPDCSDDERADFERWRRRSPAHAEAYAATERLLAGVDELVATDSRVEALMRAARELGTRPVPGYARRPRRWRPSLALAASLVVAAVGVWLGTDLLRPSPEPAHYATGTERSTIALDDGNIVELDVASRISTRFTARQRDIELHEGRALFEVAPDPVRPFTVRAGGGRITATGTRFQVERERDRVTVTLDEGAIVVTRDAVAGTAARQDRLQPGEQLVYSDSAAIWATRQVDTEAALGWSRGRLIFRGTPLAEVVAEVNRYSSRKLVLADPSLAELPVHGNFVSGDAQKVVAALEAVLPLRVDARDSEVVLHRRH